MIGDVAGSVIINVKPNSNPPDSNWNMTYSNTNVGYKTKPAIVASTVKINNQKVLDDNPHSF